MGGADYSFECIGNVDLMLPRSSAAKGLGRERDHWPCPRRPRSRPGRSSWSPGRVWRGSTFRGARCRTDVPKIVDRYMAGRIEIDPMITKTMPLDDISKGFDLMHDGKSIRSVVLYCPAPDALRVPSP
jgi:S-(hydroxymethyl)glutathione dehydrogenase/alcohol dehydrogenase